MRARGVSGAVLGAILGLAAPAGADDEIARGAVVKVEHQEIYVSVGAREGLADGAAIRIKRTLRLRHPVTRAQVVDWLPVGSATITQAGVAMSRAVIGELVDDVRVGDSVEAFVEREDVMPPAPTSPTPAPAPPQDPAAVEVLGIFAQQTGQSLDARIAGWERYLSMRAGSPYAEGIRRDLDSLRNLREQLQPPNGARGTTFVTAVAHAPRTRAVAGQEVPLVFVLDDPDRVASAYLHYRARDARTYQRQLLVRENDVYLRGALPADVVRSPGVDYFVEVSSPTGASGLALASPTEPVAIEVAAAPLIDKFGPTAGRSSVKLAIDYLDFATFDTRTGDRTDRMTTANVDFIYALGGAVQSVGVGYGVFAGSGGYEDRDWDLETLPRTGFHYGYADLELGGAPQRVPLSVGAKLIAGVGKQGFGMGVEGRFRIGGRDATNLLIAARSIEQIGTLTDIRFGARPARDLLVGVSVGATNQPNRGDIGVKLGTELEWIGFGNVSVIVRGSWQGRSVDHGGVGGGGGLGFYW